MELKPFQLFEGEAEICFGRVMFTINSIPAPKPLQCSHKQGGCAGLQCCPDDWCRRREQTQEHTSVQIVSSLLSCSHQLQCRCQTIPFLVSTNLFLYTEQRPSRPRLRLGNTAGKTARDALVDSKCHKTLSSPVLGVSCIYCRVLVAKLMVLF